MELLCGVSMAPGRGEDAEVMRGEGYGAWSSVAGTWHCVGWRWRRFLSVVVQANLQRHAINSGCRMHDDVQVWKDAGCTTTFWSGGAKGVWRGKGCATTWSGLEGKGSLDAEVMLLMVMVIGEWKWWKGQIGLLGLKINEKIERFFWKIIMSCQNQRWNVTL